MGGRSGNSLRGERFDWSSPASLRIRREGSLRSRIRTAGRSVRMVNDPAPVQFAVVSPPDAATIGASESDSTSSVTPIERVWIWVLRSRAISSGEATSMRRSTRRWSQRISARSSCLSEPNGRGSARSTTRTRRNGGTTECRTPPQIRDRRTGEGSRHPAGASRQSPIDVRTLQLLAGTQSALTCADQFRYSLASHGAGCRGSLNGQLGVSLTEWTEPAHPAASALRLVADTPRPCMSETTAVLTRRRVHPDDLTGCRPARNRRACRGQAGDYQLKLTGEDGFGRI